MFGLLKRKRPIVYAQWITPILEFSSEVGSFYASVEAELARLEVPELKTERIIYKDGGFLSSGREYLRISREVLVFDIVSAKFGISWWFSCRSAVLPRSLRWWEVFVFLFAVGGFAASYWYMFGTIVGSIALGSTLGMLLTMLVAARSWNGLDDLLLKLPVIGAIYETIFRQESYYRNDARRMFVSIVDFAVREKVKEFAAAGGIDDVQFNDISDLHQLTSAMEKLQAIAVEAAGKILPNIIPSILPSKHH